jgi:surfactin synthase thioesterase subunit
VSENIVPILGWLGQLIREDIGFALSALFGTSLGAYLAFFFERRHTSICLELYH